MKRAYQFTSLVLILAAAFLARESLQLKFYTPVGPGPGFFPFWLSLLLGMLAAIMFFQAMSHPEPSGGEHFLPRGRGALRIGAIELALVACVLLLDRLGFRLTILAFSLFLLYSFGRPNLLVMLAIAIAGSFGVYHLFVEWLHVPLPTGTLGL